MIDKEKGDGVNKPKQARYGTPGVNAINVLENSSEEDTEREWGRLYSMSLLRRGLIDEDCTFWKSFTSSQNKPRKNSSFRKTTATSTFPSETAAEWW
jgi:hypothetical protein